MQRNIIAGSIYHVLNRGVDKRSIFLNDDDRFRFVHDLFEFNDQQPINNTTFNYKAFVRPYIKNKKGAVKRRSEKQPRILLVDILAFCLMPNHYHLLLRPKTDDGIMKFMKRLNMGYALYFNEKYERSGALFEGRYKAAPVTEEAHFIHLPYYIHCNPLDLVFPEWRKCELKNSKKAFEFLENYRWSSFPDYIGKKNFPSVTQREFLLEFFKGQKEHKQKMMSWLKDSSLQNLSTVILEY